MFLSENYQEKWSKILDHPDLPQIKDSYKRAVTAVLLENQEKSLREERQALFETPANNISATDGIQKYDPILIGLVRRAMPNLMAYDICGVQPMTGPTGLIFAMRSMYGSERYNTSTRNEALFNEANTSFSGNFVNATGNNPVSGTYNTGNAIATASMEAKTDYAEMSFAIDKTTVTAKSRALKAEYTVELAQDLKAIHGLDAESELANILSTEILAEINREVVRTVYRGAKPGAQANVANAGVFDLDVDSNGRWSVEKFKGLLFQIERDANAIAQETRRGKGNVIITSADVASALAMAGVLDYSSGINGAVGGLGEIDDTGNTFVGTLNGRFKVYIDPYSANVSSDQYYVVGYKGSNAYDAGLFYCPYVPLQMYRAIGQDTFQPRIGFKTRYGMVLNPFAKGLTALSNSDPQHSSNLSANAYYRRVRVKNLM